MFKNLIYDNLGYLNFKIDEQGNVLNCKTGKILKKSIFKDGYYHVTLPMGKRGHVKSIRVHKAVAETFIDNPKNLPLVNHINEDKLNCNVTNLEWVTHKENVNKHWELQEKENWFCNNRKLSKNDIIKIRENKERLSRKKLAEIYHISKTTITNVINSKYYDGL